MSITFVCPAKEEGPHIFDTMTELYEVWSAQDYSFEVICVDDGSSDDTHQGFLDFAEGKPEVKVIHLTRNRGLGYSLKLAYRDATMDYVMFVPTNGMLDPHSMFDKLDERAPDTAILFNVENLDDRPLIRRIPSAAYHTLMTTILQIDVQYVHSMTLLPREAIVFEDLDSNRSFHVVEILTLALRKWALKPIFKQNRIKRSTGIGRSKSFKLNNVSEILLFSARLRRRLRNR